MSANNIEIVVAETVTKVAKTKTPTLSGKYIKFLVFGNWFIDRLAVAGTADEATVETMREQLELFAGVSKQTEMFDLFFQEIKDSTKSMKALIRKHNAPPKKEKKSRAKASVATDGTEIEKKRGRKKKATEVVHDKQDDLVAEIVAAAQGQGTDGSTNPSLVVEQVAEPQPKKKYVRKPKVVLAETDVVRALEPELVAEQIVEQVAEPVAETETKKKVKAVKKTDEEKLAEKAVKDAEKLAEKEKKDAEKLAEKAKKDAEKLAEKEKKDAEKLAEKTKKDAEKLSAKADKKKKTPPTSPTTTTTPANDDENDENDDDDVELDVRKITCASTGISYLLDNDNNVYDINSHNILGKFNLNNLSVNLI